MTLSLAISKDSLWPTNAVQETEHLSNVALPQQLRDWSTSALARMRGR